MQFNNPFNNKNNKDNKNLRGGARRPSNLLLTIDNNKNNYNNNRGNNNNKENNNISIVKPKCRMHLGFTMAEAVLVMTILGIIATIMITTIKPAEFKEKGLRVLAKKVMGEIDTATTQILLRNSSDGTLSNLYELNTNNKFSSSDDDSHTKLAQLYKNYLSTTRKQCNTDTCPCNSYNSKFYLKDGVCIGITTGNQTNQETIIPGEASTTKTTATHGVIFFDINAEQEPNQPGKDQFLIPLSSHGIEYDAEENVTQEEIPVPSDPEWQYCLRTEDGINCAECEPGHSPILNRNACSNRCGPGCWA